MHIFCTDVFVFGEVDFDVKTDYYYIIKLQNWLLSRKKLIN